MLSRQVKTPNEVADLSRELWALYRSGHQETIQLWLSDLVWRLRMNKPLVLIERDELTHIRTQLNDIAEAVSKLAPTAPAAPLAPKAWVTHSSRGGGMVVKTENGKVLVNFGSEGKHWVEQSDLTVAEDGR